jgi:pimeloyl-ACP methyl ester carboxylesterase
LGFNGQGLLGLLRRILSFMVSRLLRGFALLAAVAAAGLTLAWLLQRRLLYFPERVEPGAAERRARELGLEPWRDGGVLRGWRARTPGARGRLLVFHGNAGSALDRVSIARAFARAAPALPLDVYLAEYPGYGPRPGDPSERALLADALGAIAAARREGSGPLLVAGESLGSAVAALAAAEAPREVDGLVLVTPLASVPAVARRHYPLVPGFLLRDRWRADEALPRYGGPVAFLVAGRDEVVFADLGVALHDAYPGRKAMWVEEGATHNGLDWRPGRACWREVVEFFALH